MTAHYARRPELRDASYADQHAALMAQCFGTGDAYSHFLRIQGHEATEIVADCEPLQFRWASEERRFTAERRLVAKVPGVTGRRAARWLLRRIAMAQIEEFRPDVLYCQNLDFLSREELDRLRARGILVVGQIASPAPPDRQVQGFDLILTSFPHFVPRFRALGVDSEELRLAIDARVLEPPARSRDRSHARRGARVRDRLRRWRASQGSREGHRAARAPVQALPARGLGLRNRRPPGRLGHPPQLPRRGLGL